MRVNLSLLHICNSIYIMSRMGVVYGSITRKIYFYVQPLYIVGNVRGEIPQVKSLRLPKFNSLAESASIFTN